MSVGYHQVIYQLSGVLPDAPSPSSDVDVLRQSLEAYFLDDSLDSVSRELAWRNFAIPGFLTSMYGLLASDCHRIRLNDYLYNQLPLHVPLVDDQEARVFGAFSLLVDAGSEPDAEITASYLSEFMYDMFPHLDTFLRQVCPTQDPFITCKLDYTNLSNYMVSIQVFIFIYIFHDLIFSVSIGCLCVRWMKIQFTGVVMLASG